MATREYHKDGFTISTDKGRLDHRLIHHFLTEHSYWAEDRSFEIVVLSIENSLCFGVYQGDSQIGFARVVTDYSTFSWLCDVFIMEDFRGQGLGKWLISTIVDFPGIMPSNRFLLATRDAHELYSKYGGFEMVTMPEKLMLRIGRP